MKRQWIVCAQNSIGQWCYYCESATQGGRMVPNAESYARQFDTRVSAIRKAEALSEQWKGLKHWQAITD